MAKRGVGAPAGGRVHWFLWNMPKTLKEAYTVDFGYLYHNYFMLRYPDGNWRKVPQDFFVIVRTSRRCWRCMYYHLKYTYFEYFSARTSKGLLERIEQIYLRSKKSEENETSDE